MYDTIIKLTTHRYLIYGFPHLRIEFVCFSFTVQGHLVFLFPLFKGILWHTFADHAFFLPCATFFTSFYGIFQVKYTNSNEQSAVLHKSQILVNVSL